MDSIECSAAVISATSEELLEWMGQGDRASYGGAVITEPGNELKVVGLVYVAAFALDKG